MKLVYHSPMHLLKLSQQIFESVLNMQQNRESNFPDDLIMSNQCNFIVMSAACIEAHLNWYYYFDKDIDVDNFSEKQRYMPTNKKINSSPLLNETKDAVKAIFNLRNDIMHPKYQPRDATSQFLYTSHIMAFSFKTLVDVCNELLEKCPDTLKGRLGVTQDQVELASYPASLQSDYEDKLGTSWVDAIENKKIGLPMINVVDVPKPSK